MKSNLIYYRGPLERSRLSLIIEAILTKNTSTSFVWIFPGNLTQEKKAHAYDFLASYHFNTIVFKAEGASRFLTTNLSFFQLMKANAFSDVYLVGFSAPLFALYSGNAKRTWFVNGIPEEKLMNHSSFLTKLGIRFLWKLQGWASKAQLVVSVSSRMSTYVTKHTGIKNVLAIPTCTSLATFRPKTITARRYFTYLGSGASWQAIDLLEEVWYEIHQQDSSIQFRVISRDERCKSLGKRIPASHIEFVQSSRFEEVAAYLHEAEAGFLLRRASVVNQVCFPTKLGEYLAAGAWVVSTSIDWDVADYFRQYEIGVLINPKEDTAKIARQILNYRKEVQNGAKELQIDACSAVLDRSNWVSFLKNQL